MSFNCCFTDIAPGFTFDVIGSLNCQAFNIPLPQKRARKGAVIGRVFLAPFYLTSIIGLHAQDC